MSEVDELWILGGSGRGQMRVCNESCKFKPELTGILSYYKTVLKFVKFHVLASLSY